MCLTFILTKSLAGFFAIGVDEKKNHYTVMCFAFSNFNKGLQYDSFINENSDQICT